MHLCAKHGYRFVVSEMALRGAHKSVFTANKEGLFPQDMIDKGDVSDID